MLPFLSERLLDVPMYLILVGSIELALVGVIAGVTMLFLPMLGWRRCESILHEILVLAAVLLLVGCAGNSVFMMLAYGRLYLSANTVVDFYPFIPFGQWILDRRFGDTAGRLLNGAALWQIQLVWAAIAALVWMATFRIYRWLPRPTLSRGLVVAVYVLLLGIAVGGGLWWVD